MEAERAVTDVIRALQEWYLSQCDGDWEHYHDGVSIDTFDNPGWGIDVDCRDTYLQDKPMAKVEIDRSENDWLRCWVEQGRFHGRGGALNAVEIIVHFLSYAGIEIADECAE